MKSSEHNGAYITPPFRTNILILSKRTFFTRSFLKKPSYSLISEISDILSLLYCLVKLIPYTRPKCSDLYTLSQSKLLENHTLHSGTYLYSPYMAAPPPPPVLSEVSQKCV